MTLIYLLIFYIAHHRVLTGAVLLALAAAAAIPLFRSRQIAPAIAIVALALVTAFVNGMFAADFANALVYHHGLAAQARTVGSFNTYARLNRRGSTWIYAYDVLIATHDGRVVRTRFKDFDTILFPHFDYPVISSDYPSKVGDVFNVRYLDGHPDIFVIVTNDQSPWAHAHNCGYLSNAVSTMKYKYEPDPTNPDYKPQYISAIQAYLPSGCASDAGEVQALRQTLADLGAAKH